MWCKWILGLALATGLGAIVAAGVSAADRASQPTGTSAPRDEIRLIESTDSAAGGKTVAEKPSPAPRRDAPQTKVPTPAKRKSDLKPVESDTSQLEPVPDDSGATEESTKAAPAAEQPKSADESLHPIADPEESPPVAPEAASFKGVAPGLATKEDVERQWGRPKASSKVEGAVVQLYSIEPFKRVEVTYADNKVSSIVIRLGRALPAEALAKQLDLLAVRPVLVSNEVGEVLGQSYPERGVVFSFEPGTESGKVSMNVLQVMLEPISAEPFVLRAEATLDSRHDLSRRDLEQALKLDADNARAHWLLGRVLSAIEQHEQAEMATAQAVHIEPDNPQYRVTHAQMLAQLGRLPEALEEGHKAVAKADKRPHVKARATCLVADLLASGGKPDFAKALTLHTQAVQLADPLSKDQHPAVRVAAKEVLVDAYLGAAHDIAWGDWKEKTRAVTRWLDHAERVAEDLVSHEGASQEVRFRVYARSVSAYVGVRGEIDPESAIKGAIEAGDAVIATSRDPARKTQIQWELGTALYDTVQICQMRSDRDRALKHGETAVGYLAKVTKSHPTPASTFLLGRLYFRLGAIHAMEDHNHKKAVEWFDKAIPLLDSISPHEVLADLGRHGEGYIIMGVSYWETNDRQKAVRLTEKGIKWMEQAVKQGTMDKTAMAVPYGNLAAMHQSLGAAEKAARYQEMASRVSGETTK